MAREERVVRAVPLWLLREYVEAAGGTAGDDGVLAGDGWTVRLTQIEDYRVGSLAVGRVRMDVEGDAAALARLHAFLDPKLLRAGG